MDYSPIILTELVDSFELIVDIMDFATLSKNSLKDITLSIVDFKVQFGIATPIYSH